MILTNTIVETIYNGYESILEHIAGFSVITLELIGIAIIVIGAFKSIVLNASKYIKQNNKHNIRIALGQALALGLKIILTKNTLCLEIFCQRLKSQ